MNGFGGWLRQLTAKIAYGYRRFMEGRYGTDRLNMTILTTGLVLCILSMFFRIPAVLPDPSVSSRSAAGNQMMPMMKTMTIRMGSTHVM